MKPQNVFINYTNPSQQNDKRQRQKVASYIGTYYRNRSRPAARQKKEKADAESVQSYDLSTNRDESSPTVAPDFKPKALQVLSWRLQAQATSPLKDHDMHGFKTDPFQSYPIPASTRLPQIIEYFFELYGPTHLIRSHLPRDQCPKELLQSYVQYAMQHAAMFESMITLASAHMQIRFWIAGEPDAETAYHYGSTLTRLRKTLSTDDGMKEDATILTVIGLINAEYLLGNVSAYRVHCQALTKLISYRGGLDNIGWKNITKGVITGLVAQTRFFAASSSETLRELAREENLLCEAELNRLAPTAPRHMPTGPLPLGLRPLATEGRLSSLVVHLAKASLRNPTIDIRHGSKSANSTMNVELTQYVEYLIAIDTKSLADRICLMSIHRELYDLGDTERLSSFYFDMVMSWTQQCLEMLEEIDHDDEALVEMFIWSCFKNGGTMVAPFLRMASDDPDDPRFQLMLNMMQKFWQAREWVDCSAVLTKFAPMAECLDWWHMIWKKVKEHAKSHHRFS